MAAAQAVGSASRGFFRVDARSIVASTRRSGGRTAAVARPSPRRRHRHVSLRATSSTAAVPTDIPEQQDSISADADSDDDDASATMPTTGSLTRAIVEMEDDTADAMLETILQWAMDVKGVELYEAQEEAILELVEGNNVLLTTPTGSGKTMVATAAIAAVATICLLYTSPSPRDLSTSRMPSSA